jgi:hypothetical protein
MTVLHYPVVGEYEYEGVIVAKYGLCKLPRSARNQLSAFRTNWVWFMRISLFVTCGIADTRVAKQINQINSQIFSILIFSCTMELHFFFLIRNNVCVKKFCLFLIRFSPIKFLYFFFVYCIFQTEMVPHRKMKKTHAKKRFFFFMEKKNNRLAGYIAKPEKQENAPSLAAILQRFSFCQKKKSVLVRISEGILFRNSRRIA